MSDAIVINIASGMIALVGTMFTGIMAYLMARLNKQAEAAAVEVEEVKSTLARTGAATELKVEEVKSTLARTGAATELKVEEVKSTLARTGAATELKVEEVKSTLARTGTATELKVEEVKSTLARTGAATELKLIEIANVGIAVHTLVNSNMGVQLKLNAVVSRRLAEITKDRADLAAAELAQGLLHEHEAKQAIVDRALSSKKATGEAP